MDSTELPRDAISLDKLIRNIGIEKYDAAIIEQLLDVIYRHVSEVLEDAVSYQEHAGRTELEVDDVRLAIQTKQASSFSDPPPLSFLVEMADAKNSQPILLPDRPCVLVPPREYCLTEVNYQLGALSIVPKAQSLSRN